MKDENIPTKQSNPQPNPHPQIHPKNTNVPDYKIPIIIASIVIGLGIICCIAALPVLNRPIIDTTKQNNQTEKEIVQQTKFEDLTKEETIAFLRSNTSVKGILPEGYVGDEISKAITTSGRYILSDLVMIYSYDNLKELKKLARNKYKGYYYLYENEEESEEENVEDDFEITEYDYYAIVTPNKIKETFPCDRSHDIVCDSLLSFKKEFLDYHLKETVSDEGYKSVNKQFSINTTLDPEIISQLLRIYTVLGTYGYNGHGNIYSYDFEEQSDKYVLTVNIVGAGVDLKAYNNYSSNSKDSLENHFALNLYRRRFNADKSTGEIYITRIKDSTMDNVKSIPITQKEYESLPFCGEND